MKLGTCYGAFTYVASNYEMVCFESEIGKKYFLPTYGKYGYLYLLKFLVEEWNDKDIITKNITNKFEERINRYTEERVVLYNTTKCPCCKSCNNFVNERNDVNKESINWLKLDILKLEKDTYNL